MDDLNELRAEVLRRQKAANRKINRLRNKGVSVAGTVHDVRRDPSNVRRYTRKQAQAYLGQLESFIDRRNSFVGGVEGAPIPRQEWQAYKRIERAYQNVARSHYEAVKDLDTPIGKTIGGYNETMRRKRKPGERGGSYRPLETGVALEAHEVADVQKLMRLRKGLERKLNAEYLPKRLKEQRYQLMQSLTRYGDDSINELAKTLTDDQFDTMWNYTDAPQELFEGYHMLKLLSGNSADGVEANVHEDDIQEAKKWIEWAASLPDKPTRGNRKNRR